MERIISIRFQTETNPSRRSRSGPRCSPARERRDGMVSLILNANWNKEGAASIERTSPTPLVSDRIYPANPFLIPIRVQDGD